MTELLEKIEAVVKAYPFATEVLMLIVGVILGAISTAIINNLAVRKKAKFDMQYQIVKDEAENVANITKLKRLKSIYQMKRVIQNYFLMK